MLISIVSHHMNKLVFIMIIMLHLYWSESESESDVAWNGYIQFYAAYLYWSDLSAKANVASLPSRMGCNPFLARFAPCCTRFQLFV